MRARLLSALVTILGFSPANISACSCRGPAPACAYVSRAAVVFIGKVAFTDHDPARGIRQQTFVRFAVEEAFKGLSPDVREVWIDPGSFTSCYAEYSIGQRLLVFAYGGARMMPPDTPMMSVISGQSKPKPLPAGVNPTERPVVYLAPECSGTSEIGANGQALADIDYLRRYRAGNASPLARGRVVEDEDFGIFWPLPGLRGVTLTLTGNGITRSTPTDADGYYVFNDVPAGNYIIRPSLKPYVAEGRARRIEIPTVGCGVADFNMKAPGVIEGILLDASGQVAANVPVEVLRLDAEGKPIYYAQKEEKTSWNGRYRFEGLPSGSFQIGVNLFNAPDTKMPYAATHWTEHGRSSIHLVAGERKRITSFQLPRPAAVRSFQAEVHWPDGRRASSVMVWATVGDDRAAASGETDANGVKRFDVLEGITYVIEAKIWIGSEGEREVARSGAVELTPGSGPIHRKFILSKRTKDYR
jgi:hypothetical protein